MSRTMLRIAIVLTTVLVAANVPSTDAVCIRFYFSTSDDLFNVPYEFENEEVPCIDEIIYLWAYIEPGGGGAWPKICVCFDGMVIEPATVYNDGWGPGGAYHRWDPNQSDFDPTDDGCIELIGNGGAPYWGLGHSGDTRRVLDLTTFGYHYLIGAFRFTGVPCEDELFLRVGVCGILDPYFIYADCLYFGFGDTPGTGDPGWVSLEPDLVPCDTDCDDNGINDCEDHQDCGGQPWCSDCNGNGQLDVCDISQSLSNDINGNGIPDECETDCNGNGIPDTWDMSECDGSVWCSDCNGNGTLDECEVPPIGPLANDCNGNGILDWCDIDTGASEDLDGDGIPDECTPPMCWSNELTQLTPSEGGGNYGYAVAIDGNTAVVGAWQHHRDDVDPNWQYYGIAYVYEFGGGIWNQVAILSPEFNQYFNQYHFGQAVDISDDTIVVGGQKLNLQLSEHWGRAYVFEKPPGGWVDMHEDQVVGSADDEPTFGEAVAIDGETIVVGAPGTNYWSGAAYTFERECEPNDPNDCTWESGQTLNPGASYDDRVGRSVAINGDYLLVGADGDDEAGDAAGAVYAYRYVGAWTLDGKLMASDAIGAEQFGFSCDLDGTTAVIGALFDEYDYPNSGSAYVFTRTGMGPYWEQGAKLRDPTQTIDALFGHSVAIEGDTVIIGTAPIYDPNELGYTYLFERPAWGWGGVLEPSVEIVSSDNEAGDLFGWDVAISGGTIIVGSVEDNYAVGSAYIFGAFCDCNANGVPDSDDIAGCDPNNPACHDCNANSIPDECDIADGTSTDLNGSGVPDECEPVGDLNCDGLKNNGDIDPFVLAVTDPLTYAAQYPGCDIMNADCNGDGLLNNGDIDAFIALLTG